MIWQPPRDPDPINLWVERAEIMPIIERLSLTHWGWVTHICLGNLTIIGSDNGLSPGRRQAIIWTNAGILLIGPLGTNFSPTKNYTYKILANSSSEQWVYNLYLGQYQLHMLIQPGYCISIELNMADSQQTVTLAAFNTIPDRDSQAFCHIDSLWYFQWQSSGSYNQSISARHTKTWKVLNSSPPVQNGRNFADNIFRCIFLNKKFCILIKISLKFVPKGPTDNNPALV